MLLPEGCCSFIGSIQSILAIWPGYNLLLNSTRMKKSMLFIVLFLLAAGIANAQKLYLRLGVGGGISLQQYEGLSWTDISSSAGSTSLEIKSMGLGGGLNANLALGYMLSNNFGIELGVNEFIGLNNKVTYTETRTFSDYNEAGKLSGMMLQIVPAIVITPGLEKINPYARLGMIIGILPSVKEQYNATLNNTIGDLKSTTKTVETRKLSGGVALGFTAAAGASLNLSNKFSLFAEMVFNGITYAPSKGKITELTVNGVDQLPTTKTIDKEWNYEKKYDGNTIYLIPDSSPNIKPKISMNFSNVELNIGISLKL